MSGSALPQEILDAITEVVATDHPKSLGALALASRQHFLHQSQSHMLHYLQISRIVKEDDRLLKILYHNRALFRHVKNLHLYLDLELYDGHNDLWAAHIASLFPIIQALTGSVHTLSLYMTMPDRRRRWHTVNCRPLYSLVEALFAFPLEKVCIVGLQDLPIRFITSLPNLKSLLMGAKTSLGKAQGDEDQHAELDLVNRCPQLDQEQRVPWHLESLCTYQDSFRETMSVLMDLPPRSLWGRLTNLDLRTLTTPGEHSLVWSVVEEAARESAPLEMLRISYYADLRSTMIPMCLDEARRSARTLPSFPNLHYLGLTMSQDAWLHGGEDSTNSTYPPQSTIAFFSSFIDRNPQPSLEIFKLQLTWKIDEDPRNALAIPMNDPHRRWGPIDEALSSPARYPKLIAASIQCHGRLETRIEGMQTHAGVLALERRLQTRNGADCAAGMAKTRERVGMVTRFQHQDDQGFGGIDADVVKGMEARYYPLISS